MFYEITTVIGCSNNCSYCPQKKIITNYHQSNKPNAPYVLSLKNFKKILNKIPSDIDINFAGFSEPFQNPECVDMAIYAYKKGHVVRIYTTLRYLGPYTLKKLLDNIPFDNKGDARFVVHIPSDSEFKKIKFDKDYLTTLEVLIAAKINVVFSYLGDEKLPYKIESLFKKYKRHIHYGKLISRAGNIKIKNVDLPTFKANKIRCENRAYGTRGHVVLPDGRIALCCMDYGLDHILGNLLTDKFDEIENGKEFKKILLGLNNPKSKVLCRYCELATDDNNSLTGKIKKNSRWQKLKIQIKKNLQNKYPKIYTIVKKIKYLIIPFRVSDKGVNNNI